MENLIILAATIFLKQVITNSQNEKKNKMPVFTSSQSGLAEIFT